VLGNGWLCWWLLALPSAYPLTAEWTVIDSARRVSPRRSGHTSFGLSFKEHYVFGGYAEEGGPKRYVVNDLWKWIESGWNPVSQTGDIPRARLVSAASVVGNKAYLFGGWDPGNEGTGGEILDEVHELDLTTHSWKKLDCVLPDGPSSRHVALAVGENIIIHNHRCQDRVWIFDTTTQSFRMQSTSGPCPSPRGLHSATVLDHNNIVFFGGAAQDGSMSNEAFTLCTDTWKWKQLASLPDASAGRAASCLCTLNDNCVLLFGGAESSGFGLKPRGDVWALHLNSNTWEQLVRDEEGSCSDRIPPPRNAASLAKIGDGCFLLTGGWAPFQQTWDDCFVLHVSQ
jgi:hypothetical protein